MGGQTDDFGRKVEILKNFSVFQSAAPSTVRHIAENAFLGKYTGRRELYRQGATERGVYFLTHGAVLLSQAGDPNFPDATEVHLAYRKAGEVAGEMGPDVGKYTEGARTITNYVETLLVKSPVLRQLRATDHGFQDSWIAMLLERSAALEDRLRYQFMPAVSRLARYLAYHCRALGGERGVRGVRVTRPSNMQIAGFIGVSRQSIPQALERLEERGLIEVEEALLTIVDLEGLETCGIRRGM